MEDTVGGWWDVLIRKAAYRGHPRAAVQLADIDKLAPVFFRAMGGAAGLGLRSTVGTEHAGRRSLLERIAGTNTTVELAWSDAKSLYLPEKIDLFPDKERNKQLYFWLLALSAEYATLLADTEFAQADWLERNRIATVRCLRAMPGLGQIYALLVREYIPLRGALWDLPAQEQQIEKHIRQTLQSPENPAAAEMADVVETAAQAGSCSKTRSKTRKKTVGVTPVHLWMHPAPPAHAGQAASDEGSGRDGENDQHKSEETRKRRRYRAQKAAPDERQNGPLIVFRAESIFTWDNYLKVNRSDEDDGDNDTRPADDMDTLSVARDTKKRASRLRFDLDLPGSEVDGTPIGPGILLPEWDFRRQTLLPDYCLIKPMLPRDARPCEIPQHLIRATHRLRRQFQALMPQRSRRFGQVDGQDLDLDRVVRFFTDVKAGQAESNGGLYVDRPRSERSLACLLLADASLSTEAWVGRGAQASSIINVIRDSLMLFAEALQASGDSFGLYGFSSLRRKEVRFLLLKDFSEPYDATTRGRIAALCPGFYTRIGAAIRHSTRILKEQPAHKRLLLLVTDGKPNDLDHYEGRYGVEDTRQAVIEARQAGLVPFCVTIDREAGDYLPHLFGSHNYVVVHDATRLPHTLTKLYAALSQNG
ncbi:MAG: VWA domain-containing protein [Paraburkholderia sp.]|uniref:nitric oxide reductase activation protein NorD n=1 Tax=Paraburkholderia sp. TaxID=1926495 RepID=UPI00122A178A|nr:VWA domain-containing protein [Paraburkholderia sp.]TAM01818.1 MAG: VWA domain-containing protein [Paraburkholderia sp.]